MPYGRGVAKRTKVMRTLRLLVRIPLLGCECRCGAPCTGHFDRLTTVCKKGRVKMAKYVTPFQYEYWREAIGEFKKLKTLVIAALFAALGTAMAGLFIPLPVLGGQRIYFSFLVYAVGGMLYGPIMGTAVCMVGDLMGVLLFPSGAFFPGYTLTAMVGGFLYGLFFYRARLSIMRIGLCKLSVNLIANVLLNSLWSSILAGEGFWILAVARLPKNLLMLPIEIVLLSALMGMLVPILKKERLLAVSPYEKHLTWI